MLIDRFLCLVPWAVCLWTISQKVIDEYIQSTENRKLPSFIAKISKNLILFFFWYVFLRRGFHRRRGKKKSSKTSAFYKLIFPSQKSEHEWTAVMRARQQGICLVLTNSIADTLISCAEYRYWEANTLMADY